MLRTASTGWRAFLGCLKLQVILRKRATNYRALLRKITSKDSILLRTASAGWRRPIGCLKLQVILHKRATNYRALLRKMPTRMRYLMHLHHPVLSHSIYMCAMTQTFHITIFLRRMVFSHHISESWHTYKCTNTHTHTHTHTNKMFLRRMVFFTSHFWVMAHI